MKTTLTLEEQLAQAQAETQRLTAEVATLKASAPAAPAASAPAPAMAATLPQPAATAAPAAAAAVPAPAIATTPTASESELMKKISAIETENQRLSGAVAKLSADLQLKGAEQAPIITGGPAAKPGAPAAQEAPKLSAAEENEIAFAAEAAALGVGLAAAK